MVSQKNLLCLKVWLPTEAKNDTTGNKKIIETRQGSPKKSVWNVLFFETIVYLFIESVKTEEGAMKFVGDGQELIIQVKSY